MVQKRVDEDGRNGSEAQPVRQHRSRRQEDRGIRGIGLVVDAEVRVHHPRGVESGTGIVKCTGGREWKVPTVPDILPMQGRRDDPQEEDTAHEDVDDGPRRDHQRRSQVPGDLVPVEREREQVHAGRSAEDLVQSDVLGADPGDEREGGEGREQERGDDLPARGDQHDEPEELHAVDLPAVGNLVLEALVVEAVDHRAGRQRAGPEAERRPHQEPVEHAGEPEAQRLRREQEHEPEAGRDRDPEELVEGDVDVGC